MKKSVKPKIIDLLSKKFEEEEYKKLFLIDVTTNPKSNFVRVYIDGDSGVQFDDCRRISRYLEGFLDEDDEISETYTLEVSSPGVKRPLTMLRQFPQHKNRLFKLKMIDGKNLNVRFLEIVNEELVFETIPSKKNKETEIIKTTLSEIDEALVKISFN